MGKKNKSKAGGDFWDEDPELDTPQAEDFGAEQTPEPENAAVAADPEEEWADNGLMGALKRSKDKKNKKVTKKQEEEAAAEAPAVQVKSKKEKEREKKEREKAKKKAAAQRKVTAPNSAAPKKADSQETDSESSPAPEPEPEAVAEPAASSKKGGKKKKLNPALAALQKQLEAKRAAEEAREKAEEEARQQAEEEARLESERAAEAERAAQEKKERKKKEREELKAQGKLLSKKQRQQQAQIEARRKALLGTTEVNLDKIKQLSRQPQKSVPRATPEPEAEGTIEKPAEPKKSVPAPKEKEPSPEPEEEEDEQEVEEVPEEDEALLDVDDWEAALDSDDDAKAETPAEKPKQGTEAKPDAPAKSKEDTPKDVKKDQEPRPESEENILAKGGRFDEVKRQELDAKRQTRNKRALASANATNLRSPICAILGHVDVGKTKLLDNMRRTNVQEGEAGGITQQIGATYFPMDAIKKKTAVMQKFGEVQYNVPGLLIIDTPGHESFSNLRSRGSSLCNIAILVVDIMHGLEPQTIESIRLLKDRKTPFVVALNKVDRLYGWKSKTDNSFRDSLSLQDASTQSEFEDRLEKTKLAFAEQGFNSEVYYKNKNLSKFVSLVPTSAQTGEGVPDLIYLLLELTQSRMSKQLMYLSQLEATILEVKVVEGLGTTIDVILSNGILREGDRIVLCGMNGPIATNVRALLTPQPMRELRIKSAYQHHKEVKAALGVKISANGLEHAVAGSRLLLVGPDDDEDELMDDVMDDMTGLLDSIDKSGEGVCVQASTLGSLEALLDFLKDMKIPVVSISIGPVYKSDVMKAVSMKERAPQYAVMLCFDVKIDKDAEQYANEQNIKLFSADVIYHLFDDFTKYQEELLAQRRKDNRGDAVFPCVLQILQLINKRNPMIIGVEIMEGSIRVGTPICIVKPDPITKEKTVYKLGRIQSMEVDHKPKDAVRKGQANAGVAIRLDSGTLTNMPTWGRQIDEKDNLYSLISRKSIDVLKDPAFRDEVPREDWLLIKKMKPLFDIK